MVLWRTGIHLHTNDQALPRPAASSDAPSHQTHAPGQPAPENKRFYPALDGLRALAVLLILLHHYRLRPHSILEWGWVAVDLFFVLSGFLITGILFDTRDQVHRFANFYWRRVLRIFPLYYGIWIAAAAATPVFHFAWTRRWLLWPLYLGNFTHLVARSTAPQGTLDWLWNYAPHTIPTLGPFFSFGHLWSLSVEEQFYLVWPFLVFNVRSRRTLLNLCLVIVVAMPLLRGLAGTLLPQNLLDREILYRSTFFRVDSLLLGSALALMQRGTRAASLFRHAKAVGATTLLLLLATGWFAIHVLHQEPTGSPLTPWIATIGYTYVDLLSACILLLALEETSLFSRFLQIRPLQWLGRISYGFYVFHDLFHPAYSTLAFRLTRKLHMNLAHSEQMILPVAFICTTATAFLSYRLFERPFLLLKTRFTKV